MKTKKIFIGALALTIPVSAGVSAIAISTNNKFKRINNQNILTINASSNYALKTSSSGSLNPDSIVTFNHKNTFLPTDRNLFLQIWNNLQTNYNSVPEVKAFLENTTLNHFFQYFTSPKFIEELKKLVDDINHANKSQGQKKWFTLKTPSNSIALNKKNAVPAVVNSFSPKIAEFKSSDKGVFQIRLDTLGSPGMKISNGAQHLSLFIHNDENQFSGSKSIVDLIKSRDIFIRDEDKNSPYSKIDSTNLFNIKKNGDKVEVYLQMQPKDQAKIKVESVGEKNSDVKIKTGYLNSSDSNYGINQSGLAGQNIGIYSYAGNYSIDKKLKFSLASGINSKTNIPVFFQNVKNNENIKISLTAPQKLSVQPNELKVEKAIINPKNIPNFKKGHNPMKIKTVFDGKLAWIEIEFGNDGSIFRKNNTSNKVNFATLGSNPWEKIFFENIVDTSNATSKSKIMDFVSFSDPDAESKRILARTFSQWLQVDDKNKELIPGQGDKLSLDYHKVGHTNYKDVKISDEVTKLNNLNGVQVIHKIREYEKNINNILRNTGFGKYIPSNNLFEPATDYGMIFHNMYPWLYAYSEDYKNDIANMTKKIKSSGQKQISAQLHESLVVEAETILNKLVQKRSNELLSNFKRIMLQRIYEYFGKALAIKAEIGDKIIAKDAFKRIDVTVPDKNIVSNVVVKNNLNLVEVEKKLSPSYLKSVIDRILNIIHDNNFDNYLVNNKIQFTNNLSKIADPNIYNNQTDLSEAITAFDILVKLLNIYDINTKDWIEYSTLKPSEFNDKTMIKMIKEKVVEFQNKFLNGKRKIAFFGKEFVVKRIDTLVTSVNTSATLEKMHEIEFAKNPKSTKSVKLDKMTSSNLYTDSSIDKFAVSLKRYNIKDYIDYHSSNPKKMVNDLWNIDIKNMDYDLSKPKTPGEFGNVLSNSKEIAGSIYIILGLLFSILSGLGIYLVKLKSKYAYNKLSIDNLFKDSENAIIKKNKWIRISLIGLLVISVTIFIIGLLITFGAISPAIFLL